MQIELAWTIIPILIIVVLFLGTARMIFSVQDAPKPASALDVIVVGHQFWWEFRYPQYNVVTANELHVPVSNHGVPRPTFMKLTSADVMHSFWVPQLAGKTDLLPNRVNEMWIDPHADRACTWGSARSSAAWNTPRCCCGCMSIRRSSFSSGSQNQQKTQSEARGRARACAYDAEPGKRGPECLVRRPIHLRRAWSPLRNPASAPQEINAQRWTAGV